MIPDNNLNSEQDWGANDQQDRPQDLNNADAAKINEDEFERSVVARDLDKTRNTDSNTDEVRFNKGEQDQAVNQREGDEAATNKVIAEAPLTTQGDEKEIEENMGGTTNLTLDQLKQERDPEGTNNR